MNTRQLADEATMAYQAWLACAMQPMPVDAMERIAYEDRLASLVAAKIAADAKLRIALANKPVSPFAGMNHSRANRDWSLK